MPAESEMSNCESELVSESWFPNQFATLHRTRISQPTDGVNVLSHEVKWWKLSAENGDSDAMMRLSHAMSSDDVSSLGKVFLRTRHVRLVSDSCQFAHHAGP